MSKRHKVPRCSRSEEPDPGAGRSPAGLGRRRGRAGAQCWPSPGRGPADSASGQEVTQKTVRDVEKRGPRWVRNPGRPAQIRAPRLSLLGWGRGRSWGWRTSRGIGGRGRSGRPRRVGAPRPREPKAAVQSEAGGDCRRRLWAGLGPAPGPWVGRVAQWRGWQRTAEGRGGEGRGKGESGWNLGNGRRGTPEHSPVQPLVKIHL